MDISSVYRVRAKGRTYYYAWKGKGAPRLYAEPGSPEFIRELAEALASKNMPDPRRFAYLCVLWRQSDQWAKPPEEGGLAWSTRKDWSRWLDEIQRHFGGLSIAQFERPAIVKEINAWRSQWADKPRTADMAKQVLSALLSFAKRRGELAQNLCEGLDNFYRSDRSEIIWTDADLERAERVASPEVMQALRLACLTGLRQRDLLRLSWSHISALAIDLPTGKSGGKRTATVPMYEELADFLATIPKRATTVLTNTRGRPWQSGFGATWTKTMEAMGETVLHFHDARGTAATRFYLAGFAPREVAEILGWKEDKVERIINRYVRRDALLRDRIRRLDEARAERSKNPAGKT